MSKITSYDVAGLFNKAYIQVANISKAESGFRATGIYPLNPNVFTEQDFLAASLLSQETEQTAENQDANVVQNSDDAQFGAMAIMTRHLSPVAGPSNVVNEERTPVSFADIAMTPTIAPFSKRGQRKRKQRATILTATPMKTILEDKEKQKIMKLNKTAKVDKSRSKKVIKETTTTNETKILQKKNFTRQFFRE
uniref:Uncharacterized protein n=1 Tax=Heliothis virescens TaxID=7102 RepID=A0A2A4JC02_HELVI